MDTMKSQTVSDHTYRTQIITLQLVDKLDLQIDKASAVLHILFHDIEEAETGDVPSPYKNGSSKLDSSDDLKHSVLRLADTIEAYIWLSRYGINPSRVRRFLESKIIFLEKEVSEATDIPVSHINSVTSNIIESGKHYD